MKVSRFDIMDGNNLLNSCSTISLGTFEYCRDSDPRFSSSDPKEGSSSTQTDKATKDECLSLK